MKLLTYTQVYIYLSKIFLTCSFNGYLLSIFHVLRIVLATKDIAETKKDQIWVLRAYTVYLMGFHRERR